MRWLWRAGLALALILLLAVAGWFGLDWAVTERADMMLGSANNHIRSANSLVATVDGDQVMGSESFNSLESISGGSATIAAIKPVLPEADSELGAAEADAGSAAGLPLIDSWYRDYLGKKQHTASLRRQQLSVLGTAAEKLERLYAAGPVLFDATLQLDRLFGQLQDALGRVQSDPQGAAESFRQAAQAYRELQAKLDQADSQTGLELLPELSRIAAGNATVADLGAQLADAAGSGDQAAVQQASAQLESELQTVASGGNLVELWWEQVITPLRQQYDDLQTQAEALDSEAAQLFSERATG